MKRNTILLLVFLLSIQATAQTTHLKQKIKVPPPVCYASGIVERAAIPPSPEILNALKSAGNKKSDFIVTYSSTFPEQARQAFEYAVNIWENIIESPIPIYIEANWRSLSTGVLASCGPESYYANFENAPQPDIYYPIALVEKLTGKEITGQGTPDISASFNRNVDWYFQTDLNTPDTLYDFVTVALHEMAHGLGFTGFFFVEESQGVYGYNDYGDAATFDFLVIRGNGDRLLDVTKFPNRSETLRNALVSNALYNNSPFAVTDNGGSLPRLYAPSTWDAGSSIYHLNETTYPNTNPNSLMTHAIGKAEAIHDPGPITKGIMADLGWKHLYFDFERVKDIETLQPLAFKVGIQSEIDLEFNKLFLIYSTDSFISKIDTIQLVTGSTENFYEAFITPAFQMGTIQYYISAGDVKNRTFRLPAKAPVNFYSVTIGPDTEKPVITHNPIPYFLLAGDSLKISANIDDNLGVDTVFVQFSVNNVAQPPFGLNKISGTLYSGYFKFNPSQINDGDSVSYNITAIDASAARNVITEPRKDRLTFKIEKLFEPLEQYLHTFDYINSDFIESEFTTYTAAGFSNGALHSPHPYPSPNKDNAELNFTTILKRPVIIKENGTMTFDEVVLVEPGESYADFGDTEFWDYVIVEGSKDLGETWLPLINGYDSRENSKWLTEYNRSIVNQVSSAVGSPDMYVARQINLLEKGNFSAGDTILIRFRLFSDPYAHGWGWAIDNLRIQIPVSSQITALSPGNINVYPNPFSNNLNISIETKNHVNNLQADLYNIYGQKLKSILLTNVLGVVTENISTDDLNPGMYLLNIQENGQKISSVKIIKSSE